MLGNRFEYTWSLAAGETNCWTCFRIAHFLVHEVANSYVLVRLNTNLRTSTRLVVHHSSLYAYVGK